jgi:hypothetical protein
VRDKDAAKFGAIVEGLVGSACEPILATNSIKFIFDADEDPRGRAYIWIDPPWGLFRDAAEVTSSAVYNDAPDDYANWRTLFRHWTAPCWNNGARIGPVARSSSSRAIASSSRTSMNPRSKTPGTSTGMRH